MNSDRLKEAVKYVTENKGEFNIQEIIKQDIIKQDTIRQDMKTDDKPEE